MNQILTERKDAGLRIQQQPSTACIPISAIKIGQRFRKNLGNIQALADSIKKVGLLHPIVVSEDNHLIAGLRRLKACELLGWREVPVHVVNLTNPQDAEVEENFERKNFTASEIVAIKRALEPSLRAAAKKRQQMGVADSARGRPRDKIAAVVGVSHDTVNKAEKIVEAAEKEPQTYGKLLETVDAGRASINSAYKKIVEQSSDRHAQKERNITSKDKQQTILPVPLWPYEISKLERLANPKPATELGQKVLRQWLDRQPPLRS